MAWRNGENHRRAAGMAHVTAKNSVIGGVSILISVCQAISYRRQNSVALGEKSSRISIIGGGHQWHRWRIMAANKRHRSHLRRQRNGGGWHHRWHRIAHRRNGSIGNQLASRHRDQLRKWRRNMAKIAGGVISGARGGNQSVKMRRWRLAAASRQTAASASSASKQRDSWHGESISSALAASAAHRHQSGATRRHQRSAA